MNHPQQTQPKVAWIFYDGSCGVCSSWARFWQPTLEKHGFLLEKLQADWAPGAFGMSAEKVVQDLRLLHRDGSTAAGAEVYRKIMHRIWWMYPFYLLSVLPLLRSLFNWSYRSFADNRHRISKTCGLTPP